MKVYIISIETRKGDRDNVLGPFSTFEKAKEELVKYLDYWTPEEIKDYKEFDSDIDKGCIYTEEESLEIIERELI